VVLMVKTTRCGYIQFVSMQDRDLPDRISKGTIGVYGASSKMCFRTYDEFAAFTRMLLDETPRRAVLAPGVMHTREVDAVSDIIRLSACVRRARGSRC